MQSSVGLGARSSAYESRHGKIDKCREPLRAVKPGSGTVGGFVKKRRQRRCVINNQLHFSRSSDSVEEAVSLPASPVTYISTLPPATLPQLWPALAEQHGQELALKDPHANPPTQYTFAELADAIQAFAAGLQLLGVGQGDRVALFAENSARWLVADQGIMTCGAADAVRGVSSTLEELEYIAIHSESRGMVVQDVAALEKLLPALQRSTEPTTSSSAGSAHARRSTHGTSTSTSTASAPARPYSPLQDSIEFVVLLWGPAPSEKVRSSLACPVLTFDDVVARGRAAAGENHSRSSSDGGSALAPAPSRSRSSTTPVLSSTNVASGDLATLVYTSGTTGRPKGVMLTHSNLLYQVSAFPAFLEVQPGQRTLSLLPPWHVYERACAYYVLSRGGAQVITNIRRFKEDLQRFPPDHFVCVPLVLDTLHSRVMATLKKASAVRRALAMGLLAAATARTRAQRILNGVDLRYATSAAPFTELFKAWVLSRLLAPLQLLFRKLVASKVRDALGIRGIVVSGGGSLAAHLDDFYECIGLPVINGYGLTETSPVLACRSTTAPAPGGNVRGSVGRPTPGTQLRIVDPVTYKDLPDGQQGLILARGPGVMQGYYSNEAATAAAFSAGDGWLDTGDLGWKAPPENVASSSRMAGCIVLTGRAKDTIVLSSGENVEPQPIEDAICASPFVKFAILVGQNRRGLGVLVVADEDAMAAVSEARGGDSLTERERQELLRQAVAGAGTGRPAWEHVHHFVEVERPFSFEDGTLTRTMKPRRAEIMSSYAAEVAQLEAKLR